VIGFADDVGITKARLIQQSETRYVIEADVTQALAWAIKAPIFPDRFQVSELEYLTQSGWIVVHATATTNGEPLAPQDELLLPWMRNGAALTAQWLDGSVQQGLFLRSLEGIHVPLRVLMPSDTSLRDVCLEHFRVGLRHLSFKGIHLVFVGVLALLFPARHLVTGLLAYTFGQMVSLMLVEFGLPGFDLLFADILGAMLIFLLSYAAVNHHPARRYVPVLLLFGVVHSLAYAHEISLFDLTPEHRLPALFMFNIALDAGHFVLAALFIILTKILGKLPQARKIIPYTCGALSVLFIVALFQEHVIAGKIDILPFGSTQFATQFSLPTSQNPQSGGQRPRGARQLTNPVMSYLSVEPYEVRQEVLIQARAAVQFLGVNDEGMGSIPIESLEPVKQGMLQVFQQANPISIDGQRVEPVLTRADFVTLGPAGVMLRPEPVPESLDHGIVGLTLVYETQDLADDITIEWRLFSETVQNIEATTTDPFGGATMILSPEENMLRWKRRLSGYRVPVIEEIAVERVKLPVISLLLFVFVLVFGIFFIRETMFSGRRQRGRISQPLLFGLLGLGFVLYPFVRTPVDLPFVTQWAPSAERTATILEGLLTNVYRAFDVRDEEAVYDRLAMSVMGDQLTQIYLQNRQALELENRGGAQANVDTLEILAIKEVKRLEDEGFRADVVWTVSGSVSHFGHTHYRRNQNHALVTFVVDGDTWKMREIEVIEEQRLL
jgi:hypothetical protein